MALPRVIHFSSRMSLFIGDLNTCFNCFGYWQCSKNGVLVKGGVYLEEIGHLRAIAFDKTGTLTKGKPVVTDFITTSSDTGINYLSIISSLESLFNTH